MFARWRNAAAAAGALWLPCAFPQTVSLGDNTPLTRPVCAAYHDPTAADGYNVQDETWYQLVSGKFGDEAQDRSIGRPSSEACTIENELGQTIRLGAIEPADDDEDFVLPGDDARSTDSEYPSTQHPIDDMDEPELCIDSQGRCNDLSCPCHDRVDLGDDSAAELLRPEFRAPESDEAPNSPADQNNSDPQSELMSDEIETECIPVRVQGTDVITSRCPYARPTRCYDVYEPYTYGEPTEDAPLDNRTRAVLIPTLSGIDQRTGDAPLPELRFDEASENFAEPADSAIEAWLTGTIEFDETEYEDAILDGSIESSTGEGDEATLETGADRLPTDSTPASDEFADTSENSSEASPGQTPRFHLFYPGVDWRPYYPSDSKPATEGQNEPSTPGIDFATTATCSLPAAVWVNQTALSVVTWTGKLAERFTVLMGQAAPAQATTRN